MTNKEPELSPDVLAAVDQTFMALGLVVANEARRQDDMPLALDVRRKIERARKRCHFSAELQALVALFLGPIAQNGSERWFAILDLEAHAETYFLRGPRRAEVLLVKAELLRLAGEPLGEVLAVATAARAESVSFRARRPEVCQTAGTNLISYLTMAGRIREAEAVLETHPWASKGCVSSDAVASRLAAEGFLTGVAGDVPVSVTRLGQALELFGPDRALPRASCRCLLAEIACLAGNLETAQQQIRSTLDLLSRRGHFDLAEPWPKCLVPTVGSARTSAAARPAR